MRLVVTDGSGKGADVAGYFVGGKTGTAEKTGPRGGYLANKRIAAFVGAFPMNAPRYAVYVMVDEPKPNAQHPRLRHRGLGRRAGGGRGDRADRADARPGAGDRRSPQIQQAWPSRCSRAARRAPAAPAGRAARRRAGPRARVARRAPPRPGAPAPTAPSLPPAPALRPDRRGDAATVRAGGRAARSPRRGRPCGSLSSCVAGEPAPGQAGRARRAAHPRHDGGQPAGARPAALRGAARRARRRARLHRRRGGARRRRGAGAAGHRLAAGVPPRRC